MSLKPDLELYIEELVLEGFEPGDRHKIGDALVTELERLLADGGIPESIGQNIEIDMADGGEVDLEPGSRAETVGFKVAGAVYGGLSRWTGDQRPR
ncbi:MAG: hypothetical protein ACE14P_05275 [Methanotrichaceae archaeon]